MFQLLEHVYIWNVSHAETIAYPFTELEQSIPEVAIVTSPNGGLTEICYQNEVWRPVITRESLTAKSLAVFSRLPPRQFYQFKHSTRQARNTLRERGISYLAEPGHLFLRDERHTLLVELPGTREAARRRPILSSLTTATLKLAFALLREDPLLRQDLRTMVGAAGIGLGSVKRALDYLVAGGFLARGEYFRWLDRDRLIDVWAEGYAARILPKLDSITVEATSILPEELSTGLQFSGPAASSHYGGSLLSGGRVLVYTKNPPPRVALTLRAIPKRDGNVELRQAFWSMSDTPYVPVLLAYADLLAEGGRGVEEARRIRSLI